ncbi:MAG: DMT family transporter [Verrucomicrobia bacterium]|nr:MAG: DMT family transporter [Verrucomicrobiota bacterium]
MKPLHLVLLLAMNCLWAVSYSAFKALPLDAGGVATLRFGLAGLVLLLAWRWLPGVAPRGGDLVRTVAMGVSVFVFAPRLQVAGVKLGQAADASVLVALEPLVASVGAAIFLREHIGPRRWMGFALGVVGMFVMVGVWRTEFRWPDLTANVLIFLSFFCETSYSIIGKPMLTRASLFKVLTLALLAGTMVNLLIDGGPTYRAALQLPPGGWGIIAYLAVIGTVAGYSLWFIVIREAEVNLAALTVFTQPVVGVIIAVVWLDESLRWGQLWGSLVIVAGLVIGLSRQIRAGQAQSLRS